MAKFLFSSDPADDCLFSVRAASSVEDTLEQASTFLAAALNAAGGVAATSSGEAAWSVVYLIEMGKAVLDAGISAMTEGDRHD